MNEIMLTMQNENGEAVQYEVKNILSLIHISEPTRH